VNTRIRALLAGRESPDRERAYQAFGELMGLAEARVEWSYQVWDEMVRELSHRDGQRRAFAAQLLSRLALSDPDNRMRGDFPRLAAVMRDPKTVTARHTLQSIWRVGLAGPDRIELVMDALTKRFRECASDKHPALVRTDVVASLGHLFRSTGDPRVVACVEQLLAIEKGKPARARQRATWRAALA
jgi:hypothetical protein